MFTLLHTNDFHNRLEPIQCDHLRQMRRSIEGNGLLLDAGDAGGSGNITFRRKGEPILEQMSDIGYDAMTVGNRDFHLWRAGFYSKVFRAKFPVLCANVRAAKVPFTAETWKNLPSIETDEDASPLSPSSLVPVRPYVVMEVGNRWRVVIFGITVPMITEKMWERSISAFLFEDPIETAGSLVPELRAQFHPDLLIALTHIGIQSDRLLAETVPGIDLIVGGHSHTALEVGERVGETLIVQAGSLGKYVGVVEIELSDRHSEARKMRARLETL